MSVAEAAHRPAKRGTAARLWLGLLALIAAGVGLAWLGAEATRGRIVQVETIQPGSGPFIEPFDAVLVEYEGRIAGGNVFESTEGRGPGALVPGRTVPGFAEAMAKMQKGGRYVARIPAHLAYGANPPPGAPIPPNSDLEFKIHVVDVAPGAGLMAPGQQQP